MQNKHVSKKVADPVRTLTAGRVFDMHLQIVLYCVRVLLNPTPN